MRLLALEYGADIVYGEEIVDHKLVTCTRVVNDVLGTVDFVEKGAGAAVFRTCPLERGRVVFQVGTADAARALRAAELVCKDVAAFDVNMGCPRSFSTSGGMGSALLTKPELVSDIMTTLRRNLPIPVTCKIRLLQAREATVDLARKIESTGVAALAVHGRKVADRPRDRAQWEEIAAVAAALSIPVIANGDCFEYADFERIRKATGAAAVMAARSAMWNPSVFRAAGPVGWEATKREYLKRCVVWDNEHKFTKHTLREMVTHHANLEWEEGTRIHRSKTTADLCAVYGLLDFYERAVAARAARAGLLRGGGGLLGGCVWPEQDMG